MRTHRVATGVFTTALFWAAPPFAQHTAEELFGAGRDRQLKGAELRRGNMLQATSPFQSSLVNRPRFI